MHVCQASAESLVAENETILLESMKAPGGAVNWNKLHRGLVETAEWTDAAASDLIQLARHYGVFMLRNALALAVALEIADGELGQ